MISLLVPTRGRPESFAALVESVHATAMFPDQVEIVARSDDDDTLPPALGQVNIVGRRATLSSLWNDCAAEAAGPIFMQCADDIRFRTVGWDERVRLAFEEYPDKIAYVYGRDGIADERMATHGFMHSRWYHTLGYFTWPYFSSDYGDLWNHTIAERLGRLHYIEEVYTEHLHPAVGKSPIDETHRERIERDKTDRNHEVWEKAQPSLDEAVRKLQGSMTWWPVKSQVR